MIPTNKNSLDFSPLRPQTRAAMLWQEHGRAATCQPALTADDLLLLNQARNHEDTRAVLGNVEGMEANVHLR